MTLMNSDVISVCVLVVVTCGLISCAIIHVPDPGFSQLVDKLTFVQSPMLTYAHGQAVCQNVYNGHLVKYNTQEEEDKIIQITQPHYIDHYWIGLQWVDQQTQVWNDGNCTPVDPRNNYYYEMPLPPGTYQPFLQCYVDHGGDDLSWEPWPCDVTQPSLCQSAEVVMTPVNMTLHMIYQYDSDQETCQELCKRLKDCFITTNATNACIVGVASAVPTTSVLQTEPGDLITVNEADGYFDNVITALPAGAPAPCEKKTESTTQKAIAINKYQTIDGDWLSRAPPCPSPTPVIMTTSVYVTQTLTTPEVQIVPSTTNPISQTATRIMTSDTEGFSWMGMDTHDTRMMMMMMTSTSAYVNTTATATATLTVRSSPEIYPYCSQCMESCSLGSFLNSSASTEELIRELTLNRTSLSKTVRSKTSAPNLMLSAVVLGINLTAMGVIFISIIFMSDFRRVLTDIKNLMCYVLPR